MKLSEKKLCRIIFHLFLMKGDKFETPGSLRGEVMQREKKTGESLQFHEEKIAETTSLLLQLSTHRGFYLWARLSIDRMGRNYS